MVSTAATAKRRQKRKKKRISKHILESRERHKNNTNNNEETTTESNTTTTTTTTTKQQQHEKDPKEASNYIIMWKQREQHSVGWKFNKNTQSWLIRHMYEAEKVTKTTFSTLMEYFVDLKGNTRDRVKEDATRRALRYKQWETNNSSTTQEKNTDNTNNKESEGKQEENNNNDTNEDAKKWSELSDHDKRKEYKRARKVLETLK